MSQPIHNPIQSPVPNARIEVKNTTCYMCACRCGIRVLSILMSILGTIDRPGGLRYKTLFSRPIPPCAKTLKGPEGVKPNTPLAGMPLGWPADPGDLFVDENQNPVRIDKGFSWEYPLSAHGLMHNVITNAWRGDPYHIDTLLQV